MIKYIEGEKKNRLTVFRSEHTRRVFFGKHFEHVSKQFFKKDTHAKHVCKKKRNILEYSWKKQKQLNKNEKMEKRGKAFILLKSNENMGHITNFSLFPILKKTITNYKYINYAVWSKCCKSIYSKYFVVRGTFLRTYWITATPWSFNTANCFANAIDW